MAGTAVFQSGTLATPGAGIVVATDAISGTQYQLVKLDAGTLGASVPVGYGGSGLPLGTLPGGSVGIVGTLQALGTYQPLAGSVHPAAPLPGTSHITGTVQATGTAQVLGTVRALVPDNLPVVATLGTLPGGTVQTHGTSQALGTIQALAGSVHLASRLPGTADIGTIAGTVSVLGTFQPLAGSVHVAAPITGTLQVHGTVPIGTVAGTVSILGTTQPLAGSVHVANTISGTVQTHGTSQALGTLQPLAGSVHIATNLAGGTVVAVGSSLHGAAADARPLLMAAFGSSGTQAAVDDGDAVRLWADLNGRLQIRGTIDSMPAISVTQGTIPGGTIQLHGTSEILGTVRALVTAIDVGTIAEGTINAFTGTAQVLGTLQPLAGSVHVAAPVTGTMQVHGTVPVGTVAGTVSVLGTFQPLAGSAHLATNLAGGTVVSVGSAVHDAAADTRPHLIGAFGSSGTQAAVGDGDATRLWADLNGRLQVRGTIDSMPAVVITSGTVSLQTGGTIHVGSVQSVAGTVNLGTVQGTVQVRPAGVAGENFIGTIFTGAAFSTAAVLVNPASGTFVRLFDVLISGSAAGTVRLEFGSASGTLIAPLFLAANGGWSMNSTRGVRSPGTSKGLYVTASAGTWGIMVNYALEN